MIRVRTFCGGTRRAFGSALRAALVFLVTASGVAPGASALEKTARLLTADPSDEWNSSFSIRIRYYNICTGWVWAWSGFDDGAQIGMVHWVPGGAGLLQTQVLCPTGAPSGYGFTGTITAYSVEANDCPDGFPLASAPFLPTSFFTIVNFAGDNVPQRFVLVATISEPAGLTNPASFATDRPAAGPTGPTACGVCYPTNRINRSFYYGTTDAALCPGSPFNDGVCDAQLFWDTFLTLCACPVEELSWARIKCLYK